MEGVDHSALVIWSLVILDTNVVVPLVVDVPVRRSYGVVVVADIEAWHKLSNRNSTQTLRLFITPSPARAGPPQTYGREKMYMPCTMPSGQS